MLIESATERDLPEVVDLLARHGLPLDDVAQHVRTMVVAREDGRVVGTAAVELYADGALLRSVAVAAAVQGRHVGHQLTEAAINVAHEHGLDTVFLLTTTAEGFFPRFGFEPIPRDEVPTSVQTSVEFQSACPASAVVMRKRISHEDPQTALSRLLKAPLKRRK